MLLTINVGIKIPETHLEILVHYMWKSHFSALGSTPESSHTRCRICSVSSAFYSTSPPIFITPYIHLAPKFNRGGELMELGQFGVSILHVVPYARSSLFSLKEGVILTPITYPIPLSYLLSLLGLCCVPTECKCYPTKTPTPSSLVLVIAGFLHCN